MSALPQLSVVVPVKNEAGNVLPLVAEIAAALKDREFEIVYVDDGSGDATVAELAEAARTHPQLRVLRHRKGCGQSAALRTGILAARARIIATLDGDGQNDPADIPALLDRLVGEGAAEAPGGLGLVAGHRVNRRDSRMKRLSSRIGNGVRGWLLNDHTPDTGCGLKVFWRAAFLRLPYFDHIHRFLPALFQREGYRVENVPVNHRPRVRGTTKYGVMNRLWVGIVDLLGVMWLMGRMRRPELVDADPPMPS